MTVGEMVILSLLFYHVGQYNFDQGRTLVAWFYLVGLVVMTIHTLVSIWS